MLIPSRIYDLRNPTAISLSLKRGILPDSVHHIPTYSTPNDSASHSTFMSAR